MLKKFLIILLTTIFLYACTRAETVQTDNTSYPNEPSYPNETSYPNAPSYPNESDQQSYAPQPGDTTLTRGTVIIDSAEILVMESDPVQIMLTLAGSLPTPCNQLRVVNHEPDEQNRIHVDVYSVIDPGQICIQVEEPFEANFGLGSFPSGHYTVWVNGEMVGDFDA
jgi:hypothetical protein